MKSLREFRADLHIHSCLSPCADLAMTPLRAARRARSLGLDMMALVDHNSAENARYGKNACGAVGGLSFLPGLEITSSEEVHVVAVFRDVEDALSMQTTVYEKLPPGKNDSDLFGDQVIVNENDEVEGMCDRMLIGAVAMELKDVVDQIHRLGGIAIAAHIDREAFGVVGQLGFIPPDVAFDAVEMTVALPEAGEDGPAGGGRPGAGRRFPVLFSSDAHKLDEIGKKSTRFLLKSPGFDEIRMALEEVGGRKVEGGARY